MKKILIISLFLIVSLSLTAVSANDNVTSNEMQSMGLENDLQTQDVANTFENVQNTIENAEINSTVILSGTYEGTGHEISIDKDITIDGLGNTVLNANHKSRIFNINTSNVILKNLNITNGFSPISGGAIASNGKLTIINCNFINNNVNGYFNYLNWRETGEGEGGAI